MTWDARPDRAVVAPTYHGWVSDAGFPTASPLLSLRGAVPAPQDGPDAGIAWHYGDPMGEQRAAETGAVLLDGWADEHLAVSGPDRLTWLHTLTTQHLADLPDGSATQALWLSPQGHVEHEADLVELDGTVHLRVQAGAGARCSGSSSRWCSGRRWRSSIAPRRSPGSPSPARGPGR